MCAALANVEEDSWEWHAFDTVKGSDFLADQDAVDIMCKEAVDSVLDLERMGLPFNRTPEGRIDQRRFGGHTRNHGEAPVKRACYAADEPANILQTLFRGNRMGRFSTVLRAGPDGRRRRLRGIIASRSRPRATRVQARRRLRKPAATEDVQDHVQRAHVTGTAGVVYRTGPARGQDSINSIHGSFTGSASLSEAARGGGILRNGDGEVLERYAPRKDLAPRDMSREPSSSRSKRDGGPGRKGLRPATCHVDPPVSRPSSPTSPSSQGHISTSTL